MVSIELINIDHSVLKQFTTALIGQEIGSTHYSPVIDKFYKERGETVIR